MTSRTLPEGVEPLDDLARFTRAFRRYPTGVVIVTVMTDAGPVGLTVSSLASVSAEPAVVSFSVGGGATSAAAVLGADHVGVHLLPATRADLAADFARTGAPRFTVEQGWELTAAGPYLPDAVATLSGSPIALVPAGSSTVVLLEVSDVRLGRPSEPLIHLDRAYRHLTAGPERTPARRDEAARP